ncbi:hypothetical protein GCM10028789_29740 [Sinomonas halotolerans]
MVPRTAGTTSPAAPYVDTVPVPPPLWGPVLSVVGSRPTRLWGPVPRGAPPTAARLILTVPAR